MAATVLPSRDDFLKSPPEERVRVTLEAIPDECEVEQPTNQQPCFQAMGPVAALLLKVPPTVQSGVLTGLTPWLRNNLFRMMAPDQSIEIFIPLLLEMPPDQTSFLIARIPDPDRSEVLRRIEANGGDKGRAIVSAWRGAVAANNFVCWEADAADEEGRVRRMPAGDLVAELVRSWPRIDPVLGVEATRRKDEANRKGNGVALPDKNQRYADLRIDCYLNHNNWRLWGRYLDSGANVWRDFRYVAGSRTFFQELWVGDQMFFPSEAQDRILHEKVFRWARAVMARTPSLPLMPASVPDITSLQFHRVEKNFATEKVHRLPKDPRGGNAFDLLRSRPVEVRAAKPTWDFYLMDQQDRLVVLTWDEVSDIVTLRHHTVNNQVPPLIPVDDALARRFLPAVRGTRGESATDRRAIQKLACKLKAIATFRE